MVWAVKDLDVTIRGLGSVEYCGTPIIEKSVSEDVKRIVWSEYTEMLMEVVT